MVAMACIVALLFAGFLMFMLILLLRHRHMTLAKHNTWTLRLTKSGKGKFEWVKDTRGGVKYDDGRVVLTGPSRVFTTDYPPTGYPRVTQVPVGIAVVPEGNGVAFDPFGDDPIVADTQMGAAMSETAVKGALLQTAEELRKMQQKDLSKVKPVHLYILIGAVVLGFIIMGVYLYMISGQLSYIQTAFGL